MPKSEIIYDKDDDDFIQEVLAHDSLQDESNKQGSTKTVYLPARPPFPEEDEKIQKDLSKMAKEGEVEEIKAELESLAPERLNKVLNKLNGVTTPPLHTSAKYLQYAIMEILLKFGADINMIDHTGWSPFHYFARSHISFHDFFLFLDNKSFLL